MSNCTLKRHVGGIFIVIAVIVFNFHVLESDNLWDYLIDPIITLYAWAWILYRTKHRKTSIERG